MPFKPGSTFDYSGLVKGLDPAIAWGAKASLREPLQGISLGDLEATMEQTSDFATTGNWLLRLYAPASQTVTWIELLKSAKQVTGDVKFYDTAHDDPVLHTDDFRLSVSTRITE